MTLRTLVFRLFPILEWSRSYNLEKALGDLIAGITIALTLIPQSMAYALLAGMDPQYGLYGSFIGGIIYALMGTCPQVNIGPAAIISLLTFSYTDGTNVDFAILLCFIAGVVDIIAGVSQLGILVEFISAPVVSGFTSAAALTIASSQLKGLLGLQYKAHTFMGTWKSFFQHVGETSWPDALLSLVCICTLFGMRAMKSIPIRSSPGQDNKSRAKMKKILWFISVARNAVVVSLATVTASILYKTDKNPVRVTGKIVPGLPHPQLPPFKTTVGDKFYSTGDMLLHFGTGMVVIPLVGILTNVAVIKAFVKGKMDATQEIIALGVCNIFNSFFSSMPVSASISRSAVSNASGVRTPAAGICTGTLVILTLLLLTPYFYYIPRAALASVIVCAVLGMVDIASLKKIWRTSRIDLLPLVGCFFLCLALGIELGLVGGVIIDVLLILFYNSRPPLDIEYFDDGNLPPHYAMHPVGSLHYAGAEKFRSKLLSLKQPKQTKKDVDVNSNISVTAPLVVYCDDLYRMDYTFLRTLKAVVQNWSQTNRVIWCNTRPVVKRQLDGLLRNQTYCNSEQLKSVLASLVKLERRSKNDAYPDLL